MSSVNKLLDKAREACSSNSDAAFAERIGVTRQLVSQWRKGATPIPDDRIAQLARLCKDDAAQWLVTIRAEQSHGEAAKAWASLARRLGAAAAVGVVALFAHIPTASATAPGYAEPPSAVCIMRSCMALIRAALRSIRGRVAAPMLA